MCPVSSVKKQKLKSVFQGSFISKHWGKIKTVDLYPILLAQEISKNFNLENCSFLVRGWLKFFIAERPGNFYFYGISGDSWA